MRKDKVIFKCKVGGYLGHVGKYAALCGKIKVGNDDICGAHGNTKCEHRVKVTQTEV